MVKSHILKLPVPRMQIRTISMEDAARLLDSCTNLRDYLLLVSCSRLECALGKPFPSGLKISIWQD
jgi:hypothetical protein